MTTTNPLVVGGKIFNEFAMNLAISPIYRESFLSASVVLTLTPLRRDGETFEVLHEPEYRKNIIISDVFESNDPQILTTVGKVQAALQELINLKGL